MKVVLAPSILDEIYRRIHDAERSRRKVEHILVTPSEYDQVCHEIRPHWMDMPLSASSASETKFKTVSLLPKNQDYSRRLTFVPHGKLFGFDVYIVPPEYIY